MTYKKKPLQTFSVLPSHNLFSGFRMPNRIHGLAGNGAIGFSVKRSEIIHIPGNGGRSRCQRFSFGEKGRLQQLRAADIPFRTCHRLRRLLFFRRLHVRSGEFRFRSFPVISLGNMSPHDLLHVGSCLV